MSNNHQPIRNTKPERCLSDGWYYILKSQWKYRFIGKSMKDILTIAEFFTLKPVNSNFVCYRTDFNHSLKLLSRLN